MHINCNKQSLLLEITKMDFTVSMFILIYTFSSCQFCSVEFIANQSRIWATFHSNRIDVEDYASITCGRNIFI